MAEENKTSTGISFTADKEGGVNLKLSEGAVNEISGAVGDFTRQALQRKQKGPQFRE